MHYYFDVLKKYAVFEGRARRKELWMFVLWSLIIQIVLGAIVGILAAVILVSTNNTSSSASYLPLIQWIYALAVLVPSLALGARRLHDLNHSGWWQLIAIVPFVGVLILIIFFALDGTPGDNQFGPDPKGRAVVGATATPPSATN